MNREYRFTNELVRHINWNSLIPEMVDIWLAVRVVKQDDGGIVVSVDESPNRDELAMLRAENDDLRKKAVPF